MFNTVMFCTLVLISAAFFIYEHLLHKKYKKDFQKEKLISEFSHTRMKIMQMLHIKEISADSCYFRFMMKATSYSIRTLYYCKDVGKGLLESDIMSKLLEDLIDPKMKEEFNKLNSEQKELFMRVALNVLNMHAENDYIGKLFWQIYILQFQVVIMKLFVKLIKRIFDKNKKFQEKISYIEDVNHSYNLNNYALAY